MVETKHAYESWYVEQFAEAIKSIQKTPGLVDQKDALSALKKAQEALHPDKLYSEWPFDKVMLGKYLLTPAASIVAALVPRALKILERISW